MNQKNADCTQNSVELIATVEQTMLNQAKQSTAALYHLKSGGNRTRAKLCCDISKNLNLTPNDTVCIATGIELLHNASLIHDDLQDNDPVRRGKKAVWNKFGSDIAICTGDLLITKAFAVLADMDSTHYLPVLIQQIQNAVSETIRGQCLDVSKLQCDNLPAYEEIAAGKSGPLIQLTVLLPLILSNNQRYMNEASEALGRFAVAYQIADDLGDWEDDDAGGQLNIVNILAHQSSPSEAAEIAKTRAQYLLKSSQKKLRNMPNNCARSAIQVAEQLYKKVSRASCRKP